MGKNRTQKDEMYLDLETLKLSFEVRGGWSNIREFGLAVAVTWDHEHGFRRWFEGDAKSLVAELEKHSRIITYNGNRCDLEVLRGYVPNHKLLSRSFDLHVDLQKRLGHRVKLDSLAQDTLGRGKTGSGEEVVSWWRQGEKEKVCQYCENDVQLLIDLVDFARRMGYVNVDYGRVPVSW